MTINDIEKYFKENYYRIAYTDLEKHEILRGYRFGNMFQVSIREHNADPVAWLLVVSCPINNLEKHIKIYKNDNFSEFECALRIAVNEIQEKLEKIIKNYNDYAQMLKSIF